MKRCPKCDRRYSDDTLNFCLEDGATLSFGQDSEPTLISPKPTVSTTPRPTAVSYAPQHAPPSPLRWVLLAAIIFGAIILVGGIVVFIYNATKSTSTTNERPLSSDTPATSEKSPSPSVEPSRVNIPNLTGDWRLTNTIETTSYPGYANLRIGYRLAINQTGKEFTGEGEKISEDDRPLKPEERTPIHVTGSVSEDGVGATFVEEGARRKTSGRFAWTVSGSGNGLSGTFSSSAANASGSSVATREK
jgi:hypothetical protein